MITIRKSLGGVAAVLFALAMSGCTGLEHAPVNDSQQATQDSPGA